MLECGSTAETGTTNVIIRNFPDKKKRHHVPAWLHRMTSTGKLKICLSPGKKGNGRVFNLESGIHTVENSKCAANEAVYGVGWTGTPNGKYYSLNWETHPTLTRYINDIPGRSYD